jgi:di/tricarboxylate transporter
MFEAIVAGLTLSGVLTALVLTRLGTPQIFLIAALVFLASGLVDTAAFWEKAVNPGLVTLLLLMLCAVGLERLPWIGLLSRRLDSNRLSLAVAKVSLVAAASSAVLNNTAVVSAMATVLRRTKKQLPSQLLLPLSYAAILGGTLTLIGTSTNLIVSSFLSDQTGQGLLFGDFYRVSFPVLLLCIGAMVLTARWLPRYQLSEVPADEFVLEALVETDATFIGLSVEEAGLRQLETLYLTELVRGDERIRPVTPGQILRADDRLVFSGDVHDIARLDQISGLTTFAERQGLFSGDLTEAVVAPGAILEGRTVRDVGFRARFDAAIIGIQRDGERLSGEIGSLVLRAGDLLALATGPDFHARKNLRRNFLVLNDSVDVRLLDQTQAIALSFALLSVICLAALNILELSVGLLFLLLSMWSLGYVAANDLRRRFPFDIWILVSSALVIADGLVTSGLVQQITNYLMPWLAGQGAFFALIFIFLAALALTELVTNNAAAALMFPLGYAVAQSFGVDVMPFVLAVAFGASASFLTPHGYATNLIVQNVGGYRRKDYLRWGAPISLIYSVGILGMLHSIYF